MEKNLINNRYKEKKRNFPLKRTQSFKLKQG